VRPGQRRIHFSKEQDSRRRRLLAAMAELDLTARVYVSPRSVKESRELCLTALIADIAPAGASLLVLESRESMNRRDVLKRETRLLTVRRGAGSTSAGLTADGQFIV
jgi:hypothetical protein